MNKLLTLLFTLFFLSILGCSSKGTESNTDTSNIESGNAITIQKADFKEWPFTVESGRLWCDDGAILFLSNGILYGLNGTGETFAKSNGGHDLKEIWAIDQKKKKELLAIGLSDKQSDTYIYVTEVLEKGKSLCK